MIGRCQLPCRHHNGEEDHDVEEDEDGGLEGFPHNINSKIRCKNDDVMMMIMRCSCTNLNLKPDMDGSTGCY